MHITSFIKEALKCSIDMSCHRARMHSISDKAEIEQIKEFQIANPEFIYVDLLKSQLGELERLLKIDKTISLEIENYLGSLVYFPWKKTFARILNEREFIFVRTSRNRNKINIEEAESLNRKSIGIVGLSVGQAIASIVVLERCAGSLLLADFDSLELSNLNRIRTSVLNSGLSKAVIISREIAEIDPFFQVEIFEEGINSTNISQFVSKCDIVVDECDDILMKIRLRENAKIQGKPVVMDTSDNLFIDIERYDIDRDYPIFHGLLGTQEVKEDIDLQSRLNLAMKILEYEQISNRGKESIKEIGKSLLTWPQLASDVFAGGGCTVKIIREILLETPIYSQRFRFDLINRLTQNRS